MRWETLSDLIDKGFDCIETGYEERPEWEQAKKDLLERYSKQYGKDYEQLRIYRERSDTIGLKAYTLYGKKKVKEEQT